MSKKDFLILSLNLIILLLLFLYYFLNICFNIFWFKCGEYLPTTLPSLSTKNLVKFHLISPSFLVDVLIFSTAFIAILFFKPIILSSFIWSFIYVYNGNSFSPLTSALVNWSNEVLYFNAQNSCISSSVPGAWLPNWLHGISIISNPLSWYSLYSFSNPSYWGVKPHPVVY